MLYSFPPVADEQSRVLILGTMPGGMSLQKKQYYGHPQNAFWRIIFALWETSPPVDYAERLDFLLGHHIALWDVLYACRREGSLDAAIRDPIPNALPDFLAEHAGIHTIFFNGQAAAAYFRRLVLREVDDYAARLRLEILPSSSPARAIPFEEKLAAWRTMREVLNR